MSDSTLLFHQTNTDTGSFITVVAWSLGQLEDPYLSSFHRGSVCPLPPQTLSNLGLLLEHCTSSSFFTHNNNETPSGHERNKPRDLLLCCSIASVCSVLTASQAVFNSHERQSLSCRCQTCAGFYKELTPLLLYMLLEEKIQCIRFRKMSCHLYLSYLHAILIP